jgi:phage shock protein A
MAIFARLGRLVRGFFGLFISGLEERNPEALMDAAKQEFRDKMALYNQALARMAGIAERLKAQIKNKSVKAEDLARRIMANHRAGNLDLAGSLARELQELKSDLAHDTQELADTEDAYQNNLRQAKLAQKEFEEKTRRLESQLSQVKVKEAQAEAASAMSNVAEVLNKRYEVSAGKARLAKDMVDTGALREKEAESKALEQNALAEFLASQGISTAPATSEAPPAAKDFGPAAQTEQPKTIG